MDHSFRLRGKIYQVLIINYFSLLDVHEKIDWLSIKREIILYKVKCSAMLYILVIYVWKKKNTIFRLAFIIIIQYKRIRN